MSLRREVEGDYIRHDMAAKRGEDEGSKVT